MRNKYIHIVIGSVMCVLLAASLGWAAMAEVRNFTFHGIGPDDVLGPGESAAPDGKADAKFSLELSGAGGALSGLHLQSENGRSSWDTTPGNNIPGIRVQDSNGNVIAESNEGIPLTPFLLGMNLSLAVHDDGSVARGGKFIVTARFVDGSESRSTISVPAAAGLPSPAAGQVEILYARMTGKGTRDLTGRNDRLRGDGTPDYGVQIVLQGTGTITGATVRSIEGEAAQWDTLPNSDSWLVAVVQSDKVLNRPDGSIEAKIQGKSTLDLLVTDNGSIANEKSRFEVRFDFSDGTSIAREISKEAAVREGTFSGSAVLRGPGTHDYVGNSERMRGNGTNDWRVELKVNTAGTVKGMKIENTSGSAGQWDTFPGSGRWLVAVTARNGNVLNLSDGSVLIAIPGETDLDLWIEDNGSLSDSGVRSRLTLLYDDGRELVGEIVRRVGTDRPERRDRRDDDKREIGFSGPRRASSSDYVGARERIGRDGSFDWLFEFTISGKGRVKAIVVECIGASSGVWDTVPGNGNWAIGVVLPGKGGKGLLNRRDGSVSFDVPPNHNLQLFMEDNGSLRQGASNFRISVTWEDGTVTTATS